MLPSNSRALLWVSGGEILVFSLVFGLGWFVSRASLEQLRLKWRGGFWPVVRGIGYSIALRILVAVVVVAAVLIARVLFGTTEEGLKASLPHVEAVVDSVALTKNTGYLLLMLTVVSFVVAGLREELWRAGMLAGLEALFPKSFRTLAGALAAVTLVAIAFGLGHLVQGWSAVGVMTVLGIGLGAIILVHHSIWDAVVAHGCFDATTFVMLYAIARFYPQFLPGN